MALCARDRLQTVFSMLVREVRLDNSCGRDAYHWVAKHECEGCH